MASSKPRPVVVYLFVTLVVGLSCLTLSGVANAQIRYSVTKIADNSAAHGINNEGQVTGQLQGDVFVWSKAEGVQSIPKPVSPCPPNVCPQPPDVEFGNGAGEDINDKGTVVGWYFVRGFDQVPFVYRERFGTQFLMQIPPHTDATSGRALAVNNSDHVVGYMSPDSNPGIPNFDWPTYWYPPYVLSLDGRRIVADERPPIYQPGPATDVRDTGGVRVGNEVYYPTLMYFSIWLHEGGPPLQTSTEQGYYWNGTGSAFSLANKVQINSSRGPGGVCCVIPGWNNERTRVTAMNESGQIVGHSDIWFPPFPGPVTSRFDIGGFLYEVTTDTYTAIPWLPGGRDVRPWAINESGQVVGKATQAHEDRAFLWSLSGGMHNLDDLVDPDLGLRFVEARGINDGGQIIANTNDGSGQRASYLLTPAHDHPSLVAMVEALCEPGAPATELSEDALEVGRRHHTGVLNHGQCNSLLVKLRHAAIAIEQGEIHVAQRALRAFEHEVRAFLRARILTPAQAHPLLVASEHIRSGLQVAKTDDDATLEAQVPAAFELGQNVPNPFNPQTTIRLSLPVASAYTLSIYDIAGRLIRTYAGSAGATTVAITWDGTDETGNHVSSGLYFYTARAGSFAETKRMVLLK
jgi:probable HAF family extracellular repeat protein